MEAKISCPMASPPAHHDDEDDPFGMFGDEEEESQITEADQSGRFYSEALVATANNRKQQGQVQHSSSTAVVTDQAGVAVKQVDRMSTGSRGTARQEEDSGAGNRPLATMDGSPEVHLPWRKSRYLDPDVRLASLTLYGGGRGYVASNNLLPGTLVMMEEPMLLWPEEQLGRELSLVSVHHVISSVTIEELHELEHLHPTKIEVDRIDQVGEDSGDVSYNQQVRGMLHLLRDRHQANPLLTECLKASTRRALVNSDCSPFTEKDCLRLFLALRYNGLQSGIYLHVAMLNHSDQPNCVKFLPSSGSHGEYSEVRTTRPVRAGDALTINYLPTLLSHATRRHKLWEQHRFDIGVHLPPTLRPMELLNGKLPASPLHHAMVDSVTCQVEKSTEELRQMFQELASLPPSMLNQHDLLADEEDGLVAQLHALELASLELVQGTQEQLQSDCHILLIPCLELHLDCADRVLRTDLSLSPAQRLRLCGRMVSTALHLVHLQEQFHGADHFDLARTNLDLAQAIEQLLSKSPAVLTTLQVKGEWGQTLTSTAAWATREYRARKEYLRIKALYPEDATHYLGTE